MIYYVKGDVTEPKFDTDYCVIMHGVNNINIMGTGVAKALFTKWPKVKSEYHKYCNAYGWPLELGGSILTQVEDNIDVEQIVTQDGMIGPDNPKPAKVDAILKGLELVLLRSKRRFGINNVTIVMPKIGCKRGGLSWNNDVEPIVDKVFKNTDVYVYEL